MHHTSLVKLCKYIAKSHKWSHLAIVFKLILGKTSEPKKQKMELVEKSK